MSKRTKKAHTEIKKCGMCNESILERKWLKIDKNEPFCVWCKKDGLLKMMKWDCEYGEKEDK